MANLNSSIVNGFLRVTGKLRTNSLEVESNALVENLNADLLDGKEGSEYASSGDVTNLTSTVNTIQTDLATAKTDISDLTTQVNTNTGNILSNLNKIKDNTEKIGTNKDDITGLKTRMGTAETNITTNATDIAALKTKTDTTNTNLTNLTTQVNTNKTDIAALKTKTDTTNTNVTNLTSQVNTNATNITTNKNDIAALKTKTDTTNTNVAANTANIDKILKGTATIPSVAEADNAKDAEKLGGQLPAYYAAKTDLNSYLPLAGGTITGKTIITGSAADEHFFVRGIQGCSGDGTTKGELYLNYGNSNPVYINGSNLVYHAGNIPKASTTVQGIVQLNNTYTSTSTTQAPTANALKSAYDTVNNALNTHKGDTSVHLNATDRAILTKANKFKGYYETETALNNANPTGTAGDYAIVNTTDTVWIWDADKEGGAGWKDGAGKGSVISVNNMTGEVVLTKSNIGLGNVDNTSDKNKPISTATQNALNNKVSKSGDTMTGELKMSSAGSTGGQIRLYNGSTTYGSIIRNDGNNTYILLTNANNVTGTWNSLRPFSINNSNGLVTIGNGLHSSVATDSTSPTTGGLISNGGLGVAKAINSGTTITAGTDLKTKSGIVNYNDKAQVKYNATDECIEFIFS